MTEDKLAKLLLQDHNCRNCNHVNPYESPDMWCRYSHYEAEAGVCKQWMERKHNVPVFIYPNRVKKA